jgi:predicted protein tyrosine phosphatase
LKKVLFVCSQNRLRSPTAEQIFADHPGIEVSSAGTNADADNPLTPELVRWADMIFVMEKTHGGKLQQRFRADLKRHASSACPYLTITHSWTTNSSGC